MKWLPDQPDEATPAHSAPVAFPLQRKIWRARTVIAIDRLWPVAWLPLGVVGVFVLLSLAGLWPLVSPGVHRNLLWAFAAAFAVSFVPLARLKWPTREEALRRLEEVGGLRHRPATSYHDQLSGTPSPATARLWAVHRERVAQVFARLRAGWPNPRIDRLDPFALRSLLLLLLAVAFAAHYDDAGNRILAGFTPKPLPLTGAARLDAWITPPVYTGKAPIMLTDGARQDNAAADAPKSFSAPAKSELTVRVNRANASQFSLRLEPDNGGPAKTLPPVLDKTKGGTAEFRETLTEPGVIALLDEGETVARWPVAIIADEVPRIAMIEPPGEAQRGSLRFHYKVEDDYGVVSAEAVFARADAPKDVLAGDKSGGQTVEIAPRKRLGAAPVVPLVLPRANTKQGEGQTYRNLASHYWAGLPVVVRLEARDQAGQHGQSEPVQFVLPERQFSKPLARALIEQRKKLVDRPDQKASVAAALDALSIAPDIFTRDFSIYLGMRSAYWRVVQSADDAALESAADLMWSIATHIEDGSLSDAEQQLRSAQDQLMKALQENAPAGEIKRLTDDLRAALDRYLEGLRDRAQTSQEFDPNNMSSQDRTVTSQDLERMLKQIEDLARTGSKDAARQLLSEMRDILENAQNGQQSSSQSREMKSMLDGLSGLIGKQQRLLDETYRMQKEESGAGSEYDDFNQQMLGEEWLAEQQQQQQQQQSEDGQAQQQPGGKKSPRSEKFSGLGQQQSELQKQLDQYVEKLKGMGANAPEQLGGAGQAMGKAGEALGQENAQHATEQQTNALEKMRQGAKSLAEQMMGSSNGRQRGMGQNNRDPLGRQTPSQALDSGDSVKVPEEADLLRAREILDELRRRLGERARPPSELDYIERLIERF